MTDFLAFFLFVQVVLKCPAKSNQNERKKSMKNLNMFTLGEKLMKNGVGKWKNDGELL